MKKLLITCLILCTFTVQARKKTCSKDHKKLAVLARKVQVLHAGSFTGERLLNKIVEYQEEYENLSKSTSCITVSLEAQVQSKNLEQTFNSLIYNGRLPATQNSRSRIAFLNLINRIIGN